VTFVETTPLAANFPALLDVERLFEPHTF